MKNSKNIVSMLILLAVSAAGASAQTQRQSSDINERQVGLTIQRIERSSGRFQTSLNAALPQWAQPTNGCLNEIKALESDFRRAIGQFKERYTRRHSTVGDVNNVLRRASLVNASMDRNELNLQARNHWSAVKNDLNALANAYGVSWQWNQQTFPPISSQPSRLSDTELSQLIQRIDTGGDTFRLSLTDAFDQSRYDQSRSEGNMNDVVGSFKNATDQLRNQFDARQPINEYVEVVLARATPIDTYMRNNAVSNRAQNDWSTVRSDLNTLAGAYNLSANWNGAPQTPAIIVGNNGAVSGEFIVPDGESVVAVLDTDLTTKDTKQGDRFTMTVRQPGQYEGAVIDGTVGSVDQGGRVTGRSGMSLNFDSIRLRNGQTYRFAGVLESVRTMNSDAVKVDTEGSAQGDNQTTQTIQRAGIGTAIGAVIGAIAGGAKGAVIGAVVGAAGGAGSVYVQGKDNLELPRGTELTIRASAPR